ncbi:MAG TPA: hypothetical protein VGB68_17735 [Pyrinomonadaceae bacterium]|jgi:hypothetical protein
MRCYQKFEIGTALAASVGFVVIFFLFMRFAFQSEPADPQEIFHFGCYIFGGWAVSLVLVAGAYYDVTKPMDKAGRIMILTGWAYIALVWGGTAFFIFIWGAPVAALITVSPVILSSFTVLMAYSND